MDNILQKIVDGEYEIQSDIAIALDGGTISFQVRNKAGDKYELYLDRRIKTDTMNVFYIDEYPGKDGSVKLGTNEALVAKVEAALKSEVDQN